MDGFGEAVTASTTRKPGANTPGVAQTPTTYLSNLICRKLFGVLLEPVNQDLVLAEMGMKGNQKQIRKVTADWPWVGSPSAPYSADDWPVKVGDVLQLPQGNYPVRGVKPFPPDWNTGGKLELYVEVPS